MSKHTCKYFNYNLKHHYRKCTYCGKIQYNYTGKWKDQLKGLYWLEKYLTQGGTDFTPQIEIQVGYPFEMFTIESWDVAFTIKIDGKVFGPFANFNQAEYLIGNKLKRDSADE